MLAVVVLLALAPDYPLDGIERTIAARGPVGCPRVPLVGYGGTRFRYARPVRVHPAFVERLRAFEDLVVAVGRAQFGRGPLVMMHAGTYSCRRISAYPTLLSEHGLGNGIDVVGFEFGPGKAGLRRRFTVTLADWQNPPVTARARFLEALARALVERRDIFRVLLGPGYPGHKGHFHFDVAPFRLVAIWSALDSSEPAP